MFEQCLTPVETERIFAAWSYFADSVVYELERHWLSRPRIIFLTDSYYAFEAKVTRSARFLFLLKRLLFWVGGLHLSEEENLSLALEIVQHGGHLQGWAGTLLTDPLQATTSE
jgi:hypothetical protein